jgi:hypothetical protein
MEFLRGLRKLYYHDGGSLPSLRDKLPVVPKKLAITEQADNRAIIAVEHSGKRWEIDVRADFYLDGGLMVDIARPRRHYLHRDGIRLG